MTWLAKQAQKSEHVWEISPEACKAAFLAAKHHGQYGIVFCSLRQELPVVQKPQIVMLLWTFSCRRLAYFEAFVTLLVHLIQASSSSQRAILPIYGASPWSPRDSPPCAMKPAQAQVFQLHLWWGLEAWPEKKGKKVTSVGESSQHHSNAQIRFGPSRYHKIKAALISAVRLPVAESKNDSSSLFAHWDVCRVLAVTARGCSPYRHPLLRFNFRFFYFHLDMFSHLFLSSSSQKK